MEQQKIEKDLAGDIVQPVDSVQQEQSPPWPEADEKRVLRKLDIFLLPLLVLGFFVLQLDRSNIGNALTGTITEDLNISRDEVNAGNQLQIAAIVVFEIPSNIVLQRVGPSKWITFLAIAWGLVATTQAFCTNKASFYATRFLLGVFEAGYIPGCQYILASFYRRQELAVRTAIFYFGNYFAAGTGSLMAAGILDMHGQGGLAGWQWLFLIEGCMTLFVALLFLLFLPDAPSRMHGLLCRLSPFSSEDCQILDRRIILDDPYKEVGAKTWNYRFILKALVDIRLWGHMAINILSLAPKGGLQLYSPSIIKSLGFSTSKANALNSVANYGVIVLSFLVSWASDRTKVRGPWCFAAGSYSLLFAGVLWSLPATSDKWKKYAMLTVLNSGNAVSQGLNDAWLSSNCKTPQQRSVGLAMAVMGSNLGGLAGQQLFRSNDAPEYRNGFLAIICLYAAALVVVALLTGLYMHQNRQLAKEAQAAAADVESETQSGPVVHRDNWRYEI